MKKVINESALLDELHHDNKVLLLPEVAVLRRISLPTLKRLIKLGLGPKTVQLSKRLRGVRCIDYRQW